MHGKKFFEHVVAEKLVSIMSIKLDNNKPASLNPDLVKILGDEKYRQVVKEFSLLKEGDQRQLFAHVWNKVLEEYQHKANNMAVTGVSEEEFSAVVRNTRDGCKYFPTSDEKVSKERMADVKRILRGQAQSGVDNGFMQKAKDLIKDKMPSVGGFGKSPDAPANRITADEKLKKSLPGLGAAYSIVSMGLFATATPFMSVMIMIAPLLFIAQGVSKIKNVMSFYYGPDGGGRIFDTFGEVGQEKNVKSHNYANTFELLQQMAKDPAFKEISNEDKGEKNVPCKLGGAVQSLTEKNSRNSGGAFK